MVRHVLRVLALTVCLSLSAAFPLSAQQQLQTDAVEQLIRDVEPPSSEEQLQLKHFVLEFHVARTTIGRQFWDYVQNPEYHDVFAAAYRIFLDGLDIENFSDIEEEHMNIMLTGFEQQRERFYGFLDLVREQASEYDFAEYSDEEIIMRQTQFCRIVRTANPAQWEVWTTLYSVCVPLSQGP